MTNDEYRAAEGYSRSELNILRSQTPLHFINAQKASTPALEFGKACHKYILEKEDFFNEVAVLPVVDRRTKEGKETYSRFMEESEGKTIITSDQYRQILKMSEAIDRTPYARTLLTGEVEQSFFWKDSTGIKLKVRPDCITEFEGKKYLVDYKTTESCADGHFERSVRKYGYKFQAGMYREGYFQNTFEDVGFIFVAQEKTEPYAARVYFCSDGFLNEGYEQFRETVDLLNYCITNDKWFGYEGADGVTSTLFEEGEI